MNSKPFSSRFTSPVKWSPLFMMTTSFLLACAVEQRQAERSVSRTMWLTRRYLKSLMGISRLLGRIEIAGMYERWLIGVDLSSEAGRRRYFWIGAAVLSEAVDV